MLVWLKRVVAISLAVAAVALLWRGLLMLFVGIAAIFVGWYVVVEWRKWRAIRRFRSVYAAQGRNLLLVYSNSPHWERYVEDNWLAKWGHRAVVLNWSERAQWGRSDRAAVSLFRALAGPREFNPLAIVVPPAGRRAHVVRFWRAFRDYKHANDRLLRQAEAELARYLE